MSCVLAFFACRAPGADSDPGNVGILHAKRLLLVDDTGKTIGEMVVLDDRPGMHFVPIRDGKRDYSSFSIQTSSGRMVPDVGIAKKIVWPKAPSGASSGK